MIAVRKNTAAPIGAEIQCVDLAERLDDHTFSLIERAFHDNTVIYFRAQKITPQQHAHFARRFGKLEIHVMKQYHHPDQRELIVLSNVVEDGRHIGFVDAGHFWHSDSSFLNVPSRCSLLYAVEIPFDRGESVGDTLFANTAAAYDALPAEMKLRIDSLKAIHRYGDRYNKTRTANQGANVELLPEQRAKTPDAIHPVVRTHPHTGRKSIYVNEGFTAGIEGLPEQEGQELIRQLCAHCTRPEFVYRHKWQVGDLVIWDNCTSQHMATGGYALPLRRRMHRATVAGTAVV